MVRDRFSPHNTPILAAILAGLSVSLAFLMAVLCAAVVIGFLVSSGASAGDYVEATGETVTQDVPAWPIYKRDSLIEEVFLVTLIPALVGVRSALGPKTKKD